MDVRWFYLGRLNLTAGPRAEGAAVRCFSGCQMAIRFDPLLRLAPTRLTVALDRASLGKS
jgi:hypothetical protein